MKSDTFKMTTSRTFNASLDRVWDAWTKGETVKRWWGPEGFSCPVANINFKEGQTSLVCMKSPDGFEIYNTWTYTKIANKKSIEFIQHFSDKSGKRINPADIGLPPGIPTEVPHVISFRESGKGKTEIAIVESGYTNPQIVEMSKQGMDSVLNKLGAEIEK